MWLVKRSGIAVAVLVALLAAPAAASAAPDFTWSGGAPLLSQGVPDPNALNWSNPGNWVGGVAPSGSVGTLTFPALGSACVPNPQTGATSTACYNSKNDLAGISVNAIDIGGGGSGAVYRIGGDQIALGDGGITVTPDFGTTAFTESDITAPISLSAPQTWTINGTDANVGWLYVDGDVSGASNALDLNLNNGNLAVGADVEVGPISLSGSGWAYLGSALGSYLVGALNGNNGNPVSFGAGSLFDQNTNRFDQNAYDLGSVTFGNNILLQVGQPEYNASVTLPVNGGVTLSPTTQLSLLFNSHITATGPVNLGGARLSIQDGTILINGSPACNVLDVDTLITTTGPLIGTFQGIPDGSIIPLPCGLPVQPEARINYTAHAVIATLLQRTTTTLDVSDPTPPVGKSVTVTATVTPEREGESVPPGTVEFLDGGQPIAGCLAQSLSPGSTSSSARCDLSFPTEGTRNITATYSGSSTFEGSTSSKPRVIVVQAAVPAPHRPGRHGVSLAGATIPVQAGGVASVKLDCTDQTRCHGTLTLTAKRKHEARATTIGTAAFSIASGRHGAKIKLNGAGRQLLSADHGELGATFENHQLDRQSARARPPHPKRWKSVAVRSRERKSDEMLLISSEITANFHPWS